MSVAPATDAAVVQDWDDLDDAGPEQEPVSSSNEPAEQRAPEPAPATPEPTAEPTDDPARPQTAETPDERAQRLAELEARNAELERQMANREWSSEGRYRAEVKKRELLEERLKSLEQQNADEDAKLTRQYTDAIARLKAEDNEVGARALQAELRAELAERKFQRAEEQRTRAEREAAELASHTKEYELRRAGEEVRQAAIPTLQAEVARLAQEYSLAADDARDLAAVVITDDLKYLTQNAPPEVVAQVTYQRFGLLEQRAQALRERQVQQNVQQSAANGDFIRETGGAGGARDLDKAFAEADFEDALELINEGYVPPQRGKRRR